MIEAKGPVGKLGRERLKSYESLRIIWQLLLLGIVASSTLAAPKKPERSRAPESAAAASAVLWRNPVDISSRNLFYGPGGKRHVPPSTFIFVKEDGKGSNPKFVVRDASGVRWKVKMGPEARPETAATRLWWAAARILSASRR